VTATELERLTGGGVPALSDALAELGTAPAARAFVDLADASAVPAVLDGIRSSGAADRAYYCGTTAALFAVRAREPAAEIALTWTTSAPPRPTLLAALRPRWLNCRFGLLSAELADRVHADGLLVSAWTADTRRTMTRLLRLGADSITTNRIGRLNGLLDR